MRLSSFWAKSPQTEGGTTHALVCHLLDVAAAADVLLERFPRRLARLAALLDADPLLLRSLIVRLAALHDLGKFHPDFQRKLPDYFTSQFPALAKMDCGAAPIRHDILGFMIAEEIGLAASFEELLPELTASEIDALFFSVMLHHGRPAEEPSGQTQWLRSVKAIEPAINSFIDEAFALIPCEGAVLRSKPSEKQLAIFSWALAGLIVLADWIGSNAHYFTYRDRVEDLAGYWRDARRQAAFAVEEIGILPAAARENFDPLSLLPKTPGKAAELSSLQVAAATIAIAEGPNLFIVEDMTGAGKTESALILAQRLIAAGAASGLYFALPTMATSNAMHERMAGVYHLMFAEDAKPSLVLAHGRRENNRQFFEVREPIPAARNEVEDADETAQKTHARWIADDRRKAFFAHAGAGTIDQALLAALPRKYQALRLWALADRVLIVDEAHAYDAYVSRELERLIEFHTALGGSTIILSATLPQVARNAFVAAWSAGAGVKPRAVASKAYPLITAVSCERFEEKPVEARSDLCRSVPVRRIGGFEEAAGHVAALARDGAPVAWIRNAVDDAIEACEALEKQGAKPLLLHARFAMGDRLEKEQEIKSRLGRESTPEQRRGFVLVGTQILEQSLDYDVDAMVSDLAPVDLMIQRAGRLWRHPNRKGRLAPCLLMVFSPDPDGPVDADWYRAMSKRAAAVYAHHGIVWRSAKALFDAGEIRAPEGLRELIAKAYDPLYFPPALEAASLKAEGAAKAGTSTAEIVLLTLAKGYGGDNRGWSSDVDISTRLEDGPSATFRLARLDGGEAIPWRVPQEAGAEALRRAWALSEVRVQKRLASGVPDPEGAAARAVAAAKQAWSKWEQDIPLLLLEQGGEFETWRGAVLHEKGRATALYDTRLGLRFTA